MPGRREGPVSQREPMTPGYGITRLLLFRNLPPPMDSVEDILRSWGHKSLWKNLHIDGDGSWILRSINLGSLVVVHDGSYKIKVAQDVCSGAVAIRCLWTNKRARCA